MVQVYPGVLVPAQPFSLVISEKKEIPMARDSHVRWLEKLDGMNNGWFSASPAGGDAGNLGLKRNAGCTTGICPSPWPLSRCGSQFLGPDLTWISHLKKRVLYLGDSTLFIFQHIKGRSSCIGHQARSRESYSDIESFTITEHVYYIWFVYGEGFLHLIKLIANN